MVMNRLKIVLYGFICMLLLSACYHEDEVIPSDKEMALRFEFPQGNNSWDEDLVAIYEKFGVCLIYKGFEEVDFNRSWTGGGFGGVTSYRAESLNDEQALFYTNFFKNHVFAYLYPELTQKVFLTYYYMVYDLHAAWITPTMVVKSDVTYADGLDFWASCLEGEVNPLFGTQTKRPTTAVDYLKCRGIILKRIFEKALDVRNIVMPESFNAGIDYYTKLETGPGYEEDDNYYVKRGFPGIIDLNFNGFSPFYTSITPQANFLQYICLGIRYSQEELEKIWSSSMYPLLYEKRQFVINYMKETYNIDLEEINRGPELK